MKWGMTIMRIVAELVELSNLAQREGMRPSHSLGRPEERGGESGESAAPKERSVHRICPFTFPHR